HSLSRYCGVPGDTAGLPIGTRVRRGDREGTVMPHEPEFSRGRFPVRFDDAIWEVCNRNDVGILDAGVCPVNWYPRSTDDHDTHRGTLSRGSVHAACGIQFSGAGHKVLPGGPRDPQRICPSCQSAGGTR
ncbi:MAG: hypothetical protein ACRDTJ_27890, partial [Pseudonocardiaceae bacterium]